MASSDRSVRLGQVPRRRTFRWMHPSRFSSLCSQESGLPHRRLHRPRHLCFQKYLCLAVKGKVGQCTVTPFALAFIPSLFTRVMKDINGFAHGMGILLLSFLDVKLIASKTPEMCRINTILTKVLMLSLGWVLSLAKPSLVLSQVFPFLGYGYDLRRGLVFPLQDRIVRIQSWVERLSLNTHLTARQIMSFIGLLAATEKMVFLGRIHLRSIQWFLKVNWNHKMPLHSRIAITPALVRAAQWWADPENLLRPVPLHKTRPTGGTVYRCIDPRLGWPHTRRHGTGDLASSITGSPYKLPRTEGGKAVIAAAPLPHQGQGVAGENRHHGSPRLHQSAGRDILTGIVPPHRGVPSVGGQLGDCGSNSAHCG